MVENMETWEAYLNKRIKIIYDDGGTYPSKKEGICTGYTETHLFIKTPQRLEAILLNKILRVELVGDAP